VKSPVGRAALLVGLAAGPAAAQEPTSPAFDAYVRASMAAWKVPGLAIAVVKDDRLVLAKGYGVRQWGRPEPVTDSTRFAIGSATKAFTATLIGMLADSGQVRLDDPIVGYRPDFAMADPATTREITVRDALTHRSGLSGGDLLWASGGFSRDDIVRQIRFIPATWGLRDRFDYSNIMFIVAGQVAAAAGRAPLEAQLETRLLAPLGMTQTTTTIRDLPPGGDVATPHDPRPDGPLPVPWRNMDNTLAGGGINSTARDMARWLRFQLNHGSHDGARLVSAGWIDEMLTPQILIRREGAWEAMTPLAHFMAYGMGWILSDFRGHFIGQHGGGIDGMSAMVGILPDQRLGVVVLSNLNGNQLPAALMFRVFDAYLGAPPRDWSAEFKTRDDEAARADQAAEAARAKTIVAGTTPTLSLAGYTGTYRHPAWGDAQVTLENGQLRLRYGTQFDGVLEHVQYDAFRARWDNPARGTDYVNFTIDIRHRAAKLDLYLWLTASFDRVP
jgi:CubicO group peptidase (beta-lactamase class C family)